jgi:S-methylmethionine-dependent homocysteine/selenocysteine methylase
MLEILKINTIKILKNIILPPNPVITFNIDNTLLRDGKPIMEIIEIINFSRTLNISTILITSRNSNSESINNTITELKNNNIKYDLIYFYKNSKTIPICDYKKKCRQSITEKGYNIIMCIGYNYYDIYGEYTINPIKVPDISNKINSLLQIIYEEDEEDEENF